MPSRIHVATAEPMAARLPAPRRERRPEPPRRSSTSLALLFWVAASLAAAPGASAQGTPSTAELRSGVDSVARSVLDATGVPSASVAVVRDGRIVFTSAYGSASLDPEKPATPDMRYAIGSISKQFTAAAVLLLQQEGKLSLDDPISTWFPELTRADEVTLREVLSHTSGYQDFWPQDYVPPMMLESIDPMEVVRRWAGKPLDFEPGTRWQYSNTNFVLAALIVQKVSGRPFFDFLRARILDPLGLKSATDFDRLASKATDPTGYLRYGLGPLRPAPDAGSGWMLGAGELSMTAGDLARWDVSMIDRSLLDSASYRELEEEVRLKNGAGTGYGLGVEVGMQDGHFYVSHSGEVSGFTDENLVFPEDRAAVVVLTNQDAASAAGAIGRGVMSLLFPSEDAEERAHVNRARRIFTGLQDGKIDRSLFTDDANAYFSDQALADFRSSLGPLGEPRRFIETGHSERGGMTERSYLAYFRNRILRVWTYEMPDGKLEQYQVAPRG